jgi:hypothetical protein
MTEICKQYNLYAHHPLYRLNLRVDDTSCLFQIIVTDKHNVIAQPQEVPVHDSLFQENEFVLIIVPLVQETSTFQIS